MIRIGILTTANSLSWVTKLDEAPIENCEYTYIVYNDLVHLKSLFEENIMHFDGIIFSGEVPYFFIKNNVEDIAKPIGFFDVTQRDFYKTLSKIMYQNKNFSMKKILIDFVFQENEYLGLKEWLNEDDFPYIFSDHITSYTDDRMYELFFERHLSLWEEGKIDFSMTRLSSLEGMLEEHGIKTIVVHPSPKSMQIQLNSILKEIKLQNLIENQVVIGNITLDEIASIDLMEMEYRQIALYKGILDYSKKEQLSFIIHKNLLNYEIITNYSDFKTITNNMVSCSMSTFFRENLPFIVHVGWGIGYTIQEARDHASQASQELKPLHKSHTYIMTKDDALIGPLGDENCINVTNSYDEQVEILSKELNMASLQIHRIMAVMDKKNSNEIMAEDVSIHLGITIRAANRILSKLETGGYAEVSFNKQKKLKGRPKKIYKIHFNKTDSVID